MWSDAVQIEPPAAEPVTLELAKSFLSVEESDFDQLIAMLISAARGHVENITGLSLAPRLFEIRAEAASVNEPLPIGPVTDLLAVHFEATDGSISAVPAGSFSLVGHGLRSKVRLVDAVPHDGSGPAALLARVRAGYSELPQPLTVAILHLVADMFAFRETVVTGTVAQEIPVSAGVKAMLAPYRLWR